MTQRRASLLAAGVTGVLGNFHAGDPVDIAGPDGVAVARGLVNFDSDELPAARPLPGSSGARRGYEREVVHRDDLVLL